MIHIFHVHTFRCKHAGDENDEQKILTALSLGAQKITFTDHSPIPDYFRNRMDVSQLPEYISTLKNLREKYKNQIEIEIGLEAEFLPSKLEFFNQLKKNPDLQLLINGQHFYEHPDGTYSDKDDWEYNRTHEHLGCGKAIVQGMESGLFKVAAHPDRIFRRCTEWTSEMEDVSMQIIETAVKTDVILEKNLSSYEKFVTGTCCEFWSANFWKLVEKYNSSGKKPVQIIEGLDAHSSEEMISRFKYLSKSE